MKKVLTVSLLLFNLLLPGKASALKGVDIMHLDNGLTVLLKEDHALPLVTIQVWVKVGSINESEETAGLSHFLEHLIFKGTEKYPGDEITRKTETQGGVINAATSKEFTHFYIDIQKEAMEDAVRILADAMDNAAFPPAEVDRERPVVIEEIRRHDDSPDATLYDVFSEAVFLKTPYKGSIIGTEDVIAGVSREDIKKYYKTHYVPANMVVSIAGDIDTKKTLALVKESFGKQKNVAPPPQPVLIEPAHPSASIRKNKDVEHTYWLGGFLGPDIHSDEQFAGDITAAILGGGRSSRLHRKIREEKQLVYAVGSSFWSQRGSGVFAVSAVLPPKNEKETQREVAKEIERLRDEGPTDAELKRAKQMITAQWYFGRETYHDQASMIGYWHMQGNPSMPDHYIENLEKVTKEEVKDFLARYYADGMHNALLVPKVK